MENNIVNLSLNKEEEIESFKQIAPQLHFNSFFEGFAEIVSESLNKISELLADVVECFSNSGLTTKSLAYMFPANNKLKMQGKPMRRYRAYAKNGKKQKKI